MSEAKFTPFDVADHIRTAQDAALLSRETLYRTLSDAGNPRLETLLGVLRALGLRLSVTAT